MNAPVSILQSRDVILNDIFESQCSVGVATSIISFHFEIRIDSEFLLFQSILPSQRFNGLLESSFEPLEGAQKKEMMKLTVDYNGEGPIDIVQNEVLFSIQLEAKELTESTTVKFLNNLPLFPFCDCFYIGGDGILMQEEGVVFINAQISVKSL